MEVLIFEFLDLCNKLCDGLLGHGNLAVAISAKEAALTENARRIIDHDALAGLRVGGRRFLVGLAPEKVHF